MTLVKQQQQQLLLLPARQQAWPVFISKRLADTFCLIDFPMLLQKDLKPSKSRWGEA